MTRYFIEYLPGNKDQHHESQKSATHKFQQKYQWFRLSNDLVMGVGNFHDHIGASKHSNVAILSFLHDRKTIKETLEIKAKASPMFAGCFEELKKLLSLDDSATTADLVSRLIELGHSQFEPQQ